MKRLSDIYDFFSIDSVAENMVYYDLFIDSREAGVTDIFIALEGEKNHGLDFIKQLEEKGVSLILSDKAFEEKTEIRVVFIEELATKLADFSAWFYDYPSRDMKLIGITGTNGKTSVAHYTAQICYPYFKTAILGTLGNGVFTGLGASELEKSINTTLHTVSLNRRLAEFRQNEVEVVLMEVSSHAISLERIKGLEFESLALTQVTRDHLDFHGSETAYRETKEALFTNYQAKNWVVNFDDDLGKKLSLKAKKPSCLSYSLKQETNLFVSSVDYSNDGIIANIQQSERIGIAVKVNLFGRFNLENLLCAFGICKTLSLTDEQIKQNLNQLQAVSGRMEIVASEPTVIVDYAHTADALQSILHAVEVHLTNPLQKLWLLFGCGGDRDKSKRPLMGKVASEKADFVILTDDNPRFENPQQIREEILTGIDSSFSNIVTIANREEAIQYAVQQASYQDLIIIAGKGHENYQERNGVKYPMSDFQIIQSAMDLIREQKT